MEKRITVVKKFICQFGFLLAVLLNPALPFAAQGGPADLKLAEKEGQVTWYTTLSVPESRKLADIFEKRHPSIKVNIVRSGGGGILNRTLSEFAAKAHIADVILGVDSRGGIPMFKKKGIIAKYKTPERKFVDKNLRDKDGFWTTLYLLTYVLAYNTQLVQPKDVPKTYEDLLKPQWKGKKILNDTENFVWFGTLLKYWGKEKALAYFRKLAAQDQVFQRGARGRIQLVLAGEFPFTIGYGPHAQTYASQGAPIDWVPLEPVVLSPISVLLAKHAPHPNAAKLFIDFLFTKETHLKLSELKRIPSRVDVDANPPRLFKGFKKVAFDNGNADLSEIADLYRKTFGLTR